MKLPKLQLWTFLILVLYSLASFSAGSTGSSKGGKDTKGGGQSGGGGLGVMTTYSKHLILWDLFLNDDRFNDIQEGEQLQFASNGSIAEWTDYRNFKSFALLKVRLRKWRSKAKNLVSLIDQLGFAEDDKPNLYRLFFIQTSLFVKNIDEIEVPNQVSIDGIKTYPVAYYDSSAARVFVNQNHWNRLGLYSQAGTLLHERMRDMQQTFFLNNAELQNLVYMILLKDPETTEFDDSRFSQSWLTLHPNTDAKFEDQLNQAVGKGIDIYFRSQLFDCINKGNSPSCLQNLVAQTGNSNYPAISPSQLLSDNEDALKAEANGLLVRQDPGSPPLVSSGVKNVAPTKVSTTGIFSKMYGSYIVADCKNAIPSAADLSPCDYTILKITPSPLGNDAVSMSFSRNANPGIKFFSTGFNKAFPQATYEENGDQSAHFKLDSVTIQNPSFNFFEEVSIEKNPDGSFTLHTKNIAATVGRQPTEPKMDWDCTIKLQKN